MNLKLLLLASTLMLSANASAVTVNWTDWTSYDTITTPNTAQGAMAFGANSVAVSFSGQIRYAIVGIGTNYWTEPNSLAKPYTGGEVQNAPPASDIIEMSEAVTRTLTFSEAVSNLYFAYVSMNGNTLIFNQNFDITSQGQGYYGNGTAAKVSNTNGTYSLAATSGEPHGIIKFTGSFTTLSFTATNFESWYGFTVGATARTADLPPSAVPEPATYALVGVALLSAATLRRRKA